MTYSVGIHFNSIFHLEILFIWIIDSDLVPDVATGNSEATIAAILLHEHEDHGEEDGQDEQGQWQHKKSSCKETSIYKIKIKLPDLHKFIECSKADTIDENVPHSDPLAEHNFVNMFSPPPFPKHP